MALKEGKLLKQWLKRKRRITEALIVTFLITGGVAFGQVYGLTQEDIDKIYQGENGDDQYYIRMGETGEEYYIKTKVEKLHEEKAEADSTNFMMGKGARFSLPYVELEKGNLKEKGELRNTYQTAIGANARTWGGNATAIGSQSEAIGVNSSAIGAHSKTYNDSATALGASAIAYGNGSVAFGSNAKAFETYSIGIGSESQAVGDSSVALGSQSLAREDNSIAVGTRAIAEQKGSIAIGGLDEKEDEETDVDSFIKELHVKGGLGGLSEEDLKQQYTEWKYKMSLTYAKGEDSIAIGRKTHAEANEAIAIGKEATAESTASHSVSIGSKSRVKQQNGIAIGSETEADGQNSVVIGKGSKMKKLEDMKSIEDNGSNQSEDTKAKVTKEVLNRLKNKTPENGASSLSSTANPLEASVILGPVSIATGQYGVTLGHQVHNYGDDGIAVGNQSLVSGHRAIAIGKWAGAYHDAALALGYDTEAHSINGIAIGTGAIEKGNQGIAIGNLAKSKGNDSIAIGTNATVGNGQMNDMKVSHFQHLHKDSPLLGEKEVENAVAIGNKATVKVSNSVALGADSEAIKYENIDKVEITPLSLKDMKVVESNGSKIEIPTEKFAGMKKNGSNNSYGVVSIGKKDHERQLQHVAAGRISEQSTDAINGSQLFAIANRLSSGWKIANGSGYVGDVSLGKQVSFVGEDGTEVKVEQENGKGYKVKIKSPKNANNHYNFQAGNNLEVKKYEDTVKYELKDDIVLGKENSKPNFVEEPQNGKDGKITVTGKKGASVILNGADGSIGLQGTKGADGKDGAKASIKVTQGKTDLDGKNGEKGKTRLVYETVDSTNSQKTVTNEIATMNDGLRFKGDDQKEVSRKLNETLSITGGEKESSKLSTGNNIGVVSNNNDGLKIQLAKTLTGLEKIVFADNGNTQDKNTVSISQNGLNNGGKKITNVADGTKATDAVNIRQLRKTEKKGLNFMGNDGSNVHRDLGQTLRIKGEGVSQKQSKEFKGAKGNINVKHTGKSILEVQLAKDLKHIESISNGGEKTGTTITLGKTKKEVNVNNAKITNVAEGTNATDAVNVSQLRKEINDNAYTFTVSANNGEKDTINRKENVNFADSRNIKVNYDKTNKTFSYDLNHELTVGKKSSVFEEDGKDGKITVVGKKDASVTLNGADGSIGLQGPKGVDGKDGAKATIKVAQGKDDLDGTNGEKGKTRLVYETVDPKTPKKTVTEEVATMNDGLKFQGDDEDVVSKKLNETLSIKGGAEGTLTDGNIGVVSENGELKIKLAQDIENMNKITFGYPDENSNTTVSISKNGLNNGGNKIINVGDGEISETSKDAVNGSQLYKLKGELSNQGLDFVGNDGTKVHRNLGTVLSLKGEGVSEEEAKTFHSASGNINVKRSKDDELLLQLAEKLQNIQSISSGKSSGSTTIVLKEKEVVINKDLNMSGNQIKHLKEGTDSTDAVNKGQLDREVAKASTEVTAGKNTYVKESTGKNGQKQYEVGLKDSITLGEKADSKVTVDGTNGKLTIGDKISLDGKTGSATFGKIQMNQEKNEKGETKATITGLENTDITASDFAKKGRAATEEQLQKVHQDTTKKIENLSQEITQKGLNFGADQGKDVHRNLGDTQKIVGDKKNITTSITETGDLKVELNKKIEVEKLSIPKKEGGEAASISSENGVGTLYLAGKPGKDGKSTGAKISVEEGSAGVEAKDPKKETMERIVYQDSKGNSHTVATHDDGLKFQGDDGKTVNKKLNETLSITGGEQDPNKLSQGNIGVVSTENGGLTIQLAKELKDLSKITLIDGNGNKAVIDGKGLVFEGQDGKKTQLTSNGLDNGGNRITNVAAGKEPTDAVNVSQLNEVKGAVQQNAHRIDKMNGEMRRGLASAAAMSGLEFMEIGINQGTVAAAVGGWKGTQAVAVGVQGAPTENIRINGKVSVAPGYKQVDTMYSVGASYRFNWK